MCVDDVEDVGKMLCEFASQAGYQSKFYHQFVPADLSIYQNAALIILDLNMPGHDGIDVIEELSRNNITVPIILCSGVSEDIIDSSIDILVDAGLVFGGKLLKPFSYEQFARVIAAARNKASASGRVNTSTSRVDLTRGDLEIAIKRGWFYQDFQPQIDRQTNTLFGVECLARLRHPLFGKCYPDSFIKKLVEYNLMDKFTLQQVTSSLNALASIEYPPDKRISINLDPSSLRKDFSAILETRITESGFSSSQICFEITELSAVELSREVKTLLAKLRMHGFHVSLDDFGTGFSTIRELDILPFNELKIDRSFVANMEERKGAHAIIKHTIALADEMNILVIGEGVETEQQSQKLTAMGCRYLQGYYFSKPLELVSLPTLIHQPFEKVGE